MDLLYPVVRVPMHRLQVGTYSSLYLLMLSCQYLFCFPQVIKHYICSSSCIPIALLSRKIEMLRSIEYTVGPTQTFFLFRSFSEHACMRINKLRKGDINNIPIPIHIPIRQHIAQHRCRCLLTLVVLLSHIRDVQYVIYLGTLVAQERRIKEVACLAQLFDKDVQKWNGRIMLCATNAIPYHAGLDLTYHCCKIDFQELQLFLEVGQFPAASSVASTPSHLQAVVPSHLYKCLYFYRRLYFQLPLIDFSCR